MKISNTYWLALLWLLAVALSSSIIFTGCSVTRSKQTSKSSKQSSQTSTSDSTGTKKTETSSTSSKDSSGTKETVDSSGYEIVFESNDSIKPTGPVTITTTDSSVSIDPGGRKITGIKTSQKKAAKQTEQRSDANASHTSTYDSTSQKKTNHLEAKSTEVVKQVEKEIDWWPPWWVWLILAGLIAGSIYFKRKYNNA